MTTTIEDTAKSETTNGRRKQGLSRYLLLLVHWVIIVNFAVEILYGGYMVFFVVVPENVTGPLFEAAKSIDPHLMTTRRLYALEVWVATAGLAIYLAITEIGPRLKQQRS